MNLRKIMLALLASGLLLLACTKEIFPDPMDITGNWIEKTSQSEKTELSIYSNQTLTIQKPGQDKDSYTWELNSSSKLLILKSGAGESHHSISWNQKKNELTIWNLFPSIPEDPSSIVFEKI
jgi:outer membrane biogenesis lipoprotein LolB